MKHLIIILSLMWLSQPAAMAAGLITSYNPIDLYELEVEFLPKIIEIDATIESVRMFNDGTVLLVHVLQSDEVDESILWREFALGGSVERHETAQRVCQLVDGWSIFDRIQDVTYVGERRDQGYHYNIKCDIE